MEDILMEFCFHAVDQHLTGLGNTAAQNHHFGVHSRAQAAQELPHVVIELIQNFLSHSVAGLGGIKDILGSDGFDGAQGGSSLGGSQMVSGQPGDAGGRAVLLYAAVLAAVAGDGFFGVEHHVADLCAGTVGAMEQIAADDDAAANTGAQGDKNHVLTAGTAALPVFAQGGNVGIIAGLYGKAGEVGQSLGNVEHAPAQIDALVDHTLAVNRTGHADTQAQNGFCGDAVLCQIVLDGSCDVGQDLCAAVCGDGGDFPLVQHGAQFVKVGDLHGGAAQIDAKTVFHEVYLQ